jgi:hypothetical protein
MKSWCGAGSLLVGALAVTGCAASSMQGAPVRVHTTTAAFEHSTSSQAFVTQRSKRASRAESPAARDCKAGSSKACNEVGDRLVIKHAYAEARQWYSTSCDRVRGSMLPTAQRLLQLSRDITQHGSARSEDDEANAINEHKLKQLKAEVSEIRAQIQGCFDTGEMVKADAELKQALPYYETVCEFSSLVETVGEGAPGLEHVAESGCSAAQSARTKLHNNTEYNPTLFAELVQHEQRKGAAHKQDAAQGDEMVFSSSEL